MRGAILFLLVLVGGCHREPTFDEAFKANEDALASKAASIDAELDAAASDVPSESDTPGAP